MKGVWLQDLTWPEAEEWIKTGRPIVIPVGAISKEHGAHLPMNTDFLLAQMQIFKRARTHSRLDSGQVIEILVEQVTALTLSCERVPGLRRIKLPFRARHVHVRGIHQADEIKVHAVRIRRMRSVQEDPGEERMRIEGHIRKDRVMEIIAELRLVEII